MSYHAISYHITHDACVEPNISQMFMYELINELYECNLLPFMDARAPWHANDIYNAYCGLGGLSVRPA